MHVMRTAEAETGAGTGDTEQQDDCQQDHATERDVFPG